MQCMEDELKTKIEHGFRKYHITDIQHSGLCSPCHTKIDNGMGWLLPEEAIKRYRKATVLKKCEEFAEKIYRRMMRIKAKK